MNTYTYSREEYSAKHTIEKEFLQDRKNVAFFQSKSQNENLPNRFKPRRQLEDETPKEFRTYNPTSSESYYTLDLARI